MGLSLLFPALNAIAVDAHSEFLPAATSLVTQDFLCGLTVWIFMICWFFWQLFLGGSFSDTTGLKKSVVNLFNGLIFRLFIIGFFC